MQSISDEMKARIESFRSLLKELKAELPSTHGIQRINDPFGKLETFETLRGEWEKDRFNREASLALLTEIRRLMPLAKTKEPELDYGMLYNLRNMIYKYN